MLGWLKNKFGKGVSNKTTTALSLAGFVDVAIQVLYTFDTSADTQTDWGRVLAFGSLALGLLFARDADKE